MRLERLAAACAAGFVCVLAIAAYWDPTIRMLHTAEAIPYVLAGALCLRRRTVGYALAVASGLFWLWTASFLTTFVRNGFERVAMLARTGHVDRPDVLIAAPAAILTGGLALFGAAAYIRHTSKRSRDILLFSGCLAGVAAFFLAIFALFAPRYLSMFPFLH
jgi:ABC-type Na+ efflux pump permease subunit